MRSLLLLCVLGAALGVSLPDPFKDFNSQFPKTYRSALELEKRRTVFMANYNKMLEHNKRYDAGEETWWQKVHEDMDLTEEEWLAKRTGGLPFYDNSTIFHDSLDQRIMDKLNKMGPAPRRFDWVSQGKVSSVKNQAQCGSCAAFSALGATESCYAIQTGRMDDDLSEQHLLDCAYNHVVNDEAGSWGAYGCDGAWPIAYVDWMMQGRQNQEEAYYPYTSGRTGQVGRCNPNSNGYHTGARVTGVYNRWFPNELEMVNTVQMNPVSTSVLATSNWGSYGGGVLNDHSCCNAAYDSNCIYKLNHAILVVGYGTENGQDYWLIKNSWGSRWGEHGFVKLKKGTGHCGVGSMHQTVPLCA